MVGWESTYQQELRTPALRACEYSGAVDCTVPVACPHGNRAFKSRFKFNKVQVLTVLLQVPDTQRLRMSLARGPGSRVEPKVSILNRLLDAAGVH